MVDAIIFVGQLLVGLIACALILFFLIGGLIEIYDRVTGADERKQKEKEHMQARLAKLEEDIK